MKIKYTDPYGPTFEFDLPDGDPALEKVLSFLNENARLIRNAERRERYHAPYRLEAMDYEGCCAVCRDTPERVAIREEEAERLNAAMALLTETQLRRLCLQADGMTLRQIAEAEGAAVNAVKESLDAARKKLRKNFGKHPVQNGSVFSVW